VLLTALGDLGVQLEFLILPLVLVLLLLEGVCSHAIDYTIPARKVKRERRRSRGPGIGGAVVRHHARINGGGLFLPCPAWHWELSILNPGSARLACPEPDLLPRRRFWSPRRS